jgi:regulatory protein
MATAQHIRPRRQPLDIQTTIARARQYCMVQPRAHQEVRDKLYELGAWRKEVELAIAEMITSGFLSEERFALHYAVKKFKLYGWGKVKLKKGLRDKRVPDKLIAQALKNIDREEYTATLLKHARKQLRQIKDRVTWRRKLKLIDFLLRQGFEYAMINDMLQAHPELLSA